MLSSCNEYIPQPKINVFCPFPPFSSLQLVSTSSSSTRSLPPNMVNRTTFVLLYKKPTPKYGKHNHMLRTEKEWCRLGFHVFTHSIIALPLQNPLHYKHEARTSMTLKKPHKAEQKPLIYEIGHLSSQPIFSRYHERGWRVFYFLWHFIPFN